MTKTLYRDKNEQGSYLVSDYERFSYMLEPDYEWNKVSTKQVLNMLRSELGRESPDFHAKLKAILATRENIPTKQQARKVRQEKAKQQRYK